MLAGEALATSMLGGCSRSPSLRDADAPPAEPSRPPRVLTVPLPVQLPLPVPLPVPVPLPARLFEFPERRPSANEANPIESPADHRRQWVGGPGQPLALTLVQRGRLETPSGHFLTLRLLEPMSSRWRVADEAADAAKSPDDLRVEVRLFPRALPRWRLVGSASLNATGDTTWIEFNQAKLDQVLKLKVDCRWANGLEVTAVAHFQPVPDGPTVPLSMAHRQKADQQLAQWEQQLTQQRQWLAARGAFPNGAGFASNGMAGNGFAGNGFASNGFAGNGMAGNGFAGKAATGNGFPAGGFQPAGFAGGGNVAPAGKGAAGGKGVAAKLTEWRKIWEQQAKQAGVVRERLERLSTLQQTLEQEGRLHIRVVRFSTGEEVGLVAIEPPV